MEKGERIYELGFLLSGKLTLQEANELQKKLEDFLSKEAKILKKAELQKKNLAYPIKKEEQAYFGFFYFSLLPTKIKELQEKLKLFDKGLLRFLCLTPPPNFDKIMAGGYPSKKVAQKEAKEKKKIKEKETKKEPEKIDLEALEQKLEEIKELL